MFMNESVTPHNIFNSVLLSKQFQAIKVKKSRKLQKQSQFYLTPDNVERTTERKLNIRTTYRLHRLSVVDTPIFALHIYNSNTYTSNLPSVDQW